MHNIKELRKNPEEYKIKFKERNVTFDVKLFLSLDKNNRDLIYKKETLEQEKNYYQNQKIKIITKNQKKFLNKLTSYQ